MNVPLFDIAIARSGDKGDASNVGIRAKTPGLYRFLEEQLTAERVKSHFHAICKGEVERYELPNLQALNFILNDSLGGGGTSTPITDAQGKVHGPALLFLRMDVPNELLAELP